MLRSVALTLAAAGSVASQFVSTPGFLTSATGYAGINVRYKQVPTGVCEQNPDVMSFSGYADVAENEHIFWWFFEARNMNASDAPLTVWINGGPGSSSMIGLFQELGPCRINASGVAIDNPFSWSNVSNLLFIDQPTQTGFSYSEPVPGYIDPTSGVIIQLPNNTCPDYATDLQCGTYSSYNVSLTANSTPSAAPNMWKTLQGFMGAFPQYSQNGFYFATESYGGHYGPIFNNYFLEQNAMISNSSNSSSSSNGSTSDAVAINLQGILIGNGWFDPLLQYAAYYNYTVSPGNTYDLFPYNASVESQIYNNMYGPGNCYDQIVTCNTNLDPEVCSTADTFCANQVEFFLDSVAGRDEYDVRELAPDPFPQEYFVDYLNDPDVQSAIGAYINFTESSVTVGAAFGATGDDAISFDIPAVIGNIISQNVPVHLYFGDADYNCNWLGGLAVIDIITPTPPGYSNAGYTNITNIPCPTYLDQSQQSSNASSGGTNSSATTNSTIAGGLDPQLSCSSAETTYGEVRQTSLFSFTRVFESGHEVPFYQPALSLEFFRRIVAGLDIASGGYNVSTGAMINSTSSSSSNSTSSSNTTSSSNSTGMGYISNGTSTPQFVEGNTTVLYDNVNSDGVYDVVTGQGMNSTSGDSSSSDSNSTSSAARSLARHNTPRRHLNIQNTNMRQVERFNTAGVLKRAADRRRSDHGIVKRAVEGQRRPSLNRKNLKKIRRGEFR